jgi:polysaccharide biosynthesis transport protein
MDLRYFLAIIERRKWVILATFALASIVSIVGTTLMTPIYRASTTLLVATGAGGTVENLRYDDLMYADRLVNTYARIATSEPVVSQVNERFGRAEAPRIIVDVPANTELMRVSVEDANPRLAAEMSNALAQILIVHVREQYNSSARAAEEVISRQLVQTEEELRQARERYETLLATEGANPDHVAVARRILLTKEETQARLIDQRDRIHVVQAIRGNTISIVDSAAIPEVPSQPRPALILALGMLAGLVGGLSLAFVVENLDRTMHTTKQIEDATDLPILGMIPGAKGLSRAGLFDSGSPEDEAIRRLRTSLVTTNRQQPARTMLVTSAEQGEGKTTILANLARAMAQAGRQVVVVDANLRAPSLHRVFDLPPSGGLSSVLANKIELDRALQRTKTAGVWAVTSGPLPVNPAEMLDSTQMASVIDQLAKQFDLVLLDGPSFLEVTDAALLAPVVDGVLLVVARSRSREESVRAARQQLDDLEARLIGVIVTRSERVRSLEMHRSIVAHQAVENGKRASIQEAGPVRLSKARNR